MSSIWDSSNSNIIKSSPTIDHGLLIAAEQQAQTSSTILQTEKVDLKGALKLADQYGGKPSDYMDMTQAQLADKLGGKPSDYSNFTTSQPKEQPKPAPAPPGIGPTPPPDDNIAPIIDMGPEPSTEPAPAPPGIGPTPNLDDDIAPIIDIEPETPKTESVNPPTEPVKAPDLDSVEPVSPPPAETKQEPPKTSDNTIKVAPEGMSNTAALALGMMPFQTAKDLGIEGDTVSQAELDNINQESADKEVGILDTEAPLPPVRDGDAIPNTIQGERKDNKTTFSVLYDAQTDDRKATAPDMSQVTDALPKVGDVFAGGIVTGVDTKTGRITVNRDDRITQWGTGQEWYVLVDDNWERTGPTGLLYGDVLGLGVSNGTPDLDYDTWQAANKTLDKYPDVLAAVADGVDSQTLKNAGYSSTMANALVDLKDYIKDGTIDVEAALADGVPTKTLGQVGVSVTDINASQSAMAQHMKDLSDIVGYTVSSSNLEKAQTDVDEIIKSVEAMQDYVKKYEAPHIELNGYSGKAVTEVSEASKLADKYGGKPSDYMTPQKIGEEYIDIEGAIKANVPKDVILKGAGLTEAQYDANKYLVEELSQYKTFNPEKGENEYSLLAAAWDGKDLSPLEALGFDKNVLAETKKMAKETPDFKTFKANYPKQSGEEHFKLYVDKYGFDSWVADQYTDFAAFLFPPARAAKPSVELKDISGEEWAWGAVNVGLLAAPLLGKLVKGIKIGKVNVPVKTVEGAKAEDLTVWKGLSVLDRPVIGKSGGKLTVGSRNITLPEAKAIDAGYRPTTMLETRVTATPQALKKMGFADDEAAKILRTVEETQKFAGKASPYTSATTQPEAIKTLSEKGVQKVIETAVKNNKRVKQVYGSSTIKQQLSPELRNWRKPGDIDIMTDFNKAELTQFADDLANTLKRTEGAKNIRVSKDNPFLIEARGKNGQWHHAIDLHSSKVTDAYIPPEGAFGMKFDGPRVTANYPGIGKVEIMSLSESGIRKLSSIASMNAGKVGPAAHRSKDIADFYVILRTFKGKKLADAWAKSYGVDPADLMKIASTSPIKVGGWKFSPAAASKGAGKLPSISIKPAVGMSISPSIRTAISNPVHPVSPKASPASASPGKMTASPSKFASPGSPGKGSVSVRTSPTLVKSLGKPEPPSSGLVSPSPKTQTSPSPAKSTSPSPTGSVSPSPTGSVSPSPSPSPSPKSRQTPSPSPVPPPPSLPIPSAGTGKAGRKSDKSDTGTERLEMGDGDIAWLQGYLKRGDRLAPQWIIVRKNGTREYTEEPPEGAPRKHGTPGETFFTRGDEPIQDARVRMGITTAEIDLNNNPKIDFIRAKTPKLGGNIPRNVRRQIGMR